MKRCTQHLEQECIPVGCVPAAHRPYAAVFFPRGGLPGRGGSPWSWGVLPGWGGSPWSGGVLLGPGGILLGPGWGGSPWSRVGGFSLVRGGSPWSRGVFLGPRGSPWFAGFLPGPGGVLRRPPSVNRITDTCKNITLATTSLRPVIIRS